MDAKYVIERLEQMMPQRTPNPTTQGEGLANALAEKDAQVLRFAIEAVRKQAAVSA